MRQFARARSAVFAGDPRIWRAAGIVALPLLALIAFHCLRPRPYFTGTDSVDQATFFSRAPSGAPICTPTVLEVPSGTAFLRLRVRSPTRVRPVLQLTLRVGSSTVHSTLPSRLVPSDRISNADFPVPATPARPEARLASLCASASQGGVEWIGAGTPSLS
ncbi:MAG: hypothetical protein ACYDC2_12215, partial [Solirubrobacteraceae bacterium]